MICDLLCIVNAYNDMSISINVKSLTLSSLTQLSIPLV